MVAACVMNFISYYYAVSLYPKATFLLKRSVYSYDISSNGDMGPVNKYKSRGYTYEEKDVHHYPELYFPKINRRVGDRHLWLIGMRPEDEPERENPLMANTW